MNEGEVRPLLIAAPITTHQGRQDPPTFGSIGSVQPQNDELHLELFQDDDDRDNDSLFHAGGSSNDDESSSSSSLKSSLSQVIVNMVKMCIGTGVLAIPFAANEGGLIFHVLGTGALFLWNYYSVQLLVQSEQYIMKYKHHHRHKYRRNKLKNSDTVAAEEISLQRVESQTSLDDSESTTSCTIPTSTRTSHNNNDDPASHQQQQQQSTFSRIAAEAFGPMGMHMIDCSMIFLMMGIVIAYEDAVLGFLEQTHITTGSTRMDALCLIIIMTPILHLPSYESAAKISAVGTGLLFVIFIVIGIYGIQANGLVGLHNLLSSTTTTNHDDTNGTVLSMWPRSMASFSKWFGVVVFSNGIVPFTYDLKESIKEPDRRIMMKATRHSLWIVFVAYSVIGCVLSIIFVNGIQTDVISCLPQGYLPGIIRVSMAIVVLTSLPLTIIPTGVLIHSKVAAIVKHVATGGGGGGSSSSSSLLAQYTYHQDDPNSAFALRFIIASICAMISVEVPNFVYVVSFIGCFCVAFISFVYPALLHMTSMRKLYSAVAEEEEQEETCQSSKKARRRLLILDVVLVVMGIVVVALTSVLTFLSMIEQMRGS